MSDKPFRIAHLVTHPIQYFAPLYRAVNSQPNVELTVLFYSDMGLAGAMDKDFGQVIRWDNDLTGGYAAVFPKSGVGKKARLGLRQKPNWDLIKALWSGHFDAVWVHGYQHPNALIARGLCVLKGIPWLVREDQTLLEPRRWHVRAVKRLIGAGLFCGRRSGALYTGQNSRAHFLAMGAAPAKAFPARHHVDDRFFATQAEILRPRKQELRASFGITDDAPAIVFCGKLIEKKQPLQLIDAVSQVLKRHPCWLLIIGEGQLRKQAEQRAAELGIADRVIFAGFLNQGAMPTAYAASDIFVLPSLAHETWGLVVNEAMHSGLPIVISDHVGSGADLLEDGVNGYVHQAGNVVSLANALGKLVESPALRREFGAVSCRSIATFTAEHCARDVVAACRELSR